MWFPKLSLPVIAAYAPKSWDIELVDETVKDGDFDAPWIWSGLGHDVLCVPLAYVEWKDDETTPGRAGGHRAGI